MIINYDEKKVNMTTEKFKATVNFLGDSINKKLAALDGKFESSKQRENSYDYIRYMAMLDALISVVCVADVFDDNGFFKE